MFSDLFWLCVYYLDFLNEYRLFGKFDEMIFGIIYLVFNSVGFVDFLELLVFIIVINVSYLFI